MRNQEAQFSTLVIEENGTSKTVTKQCEIKNETKKFYTKLYSNHDHLINETIDTFLGPTANSVPKLNANQSEKMEGYITIDEMTKYLKKTKNNVSPGSSGFTGDF